jgi:hypothetical protein
MADADTPNPDHADSDPPRDSSIIRQSGGVDLDANSLRIGKDEVRHDQIEIHAAPGSTMTIN